jgi:hypothetical protein
MVQCFYNINTSLLITGCPTIQCTLAKNSYFLKTPSLFPYVVRCRFCPPHLSRYFRLAFLFANQID